MAKRRRAVSKKPLNPPGKPVPIVIDQPPIVTSTTTALSQDGITWVLDGSPTHGTYVTGEHWVVGPVTVLSVSPGFDGTKNGSMVNPDPADTTQGYDTRNTGFTYAAGKRQTFPVTLNGSSGGDSLVSTIGLSSPQVGGAASTLDVAAVLTVVASAPPANSFRPPYAYVAAGKAHWDTSQVNYTLLPNLADPPNVNGGSGAIPSMTNMLKYVMLDHGPKTWGATIHPLTNFNGETYYGFMYVGWAFAYVLLDKADRDTMANRIIQLGIDLYANQLRNGDGYLPDGGFNNNRKWPILFAGLLLGDTSTDGMQQPPLMQTANGYSFAKFGEDGFTYYGHGPDGTPRFGEDCAVEGINDPWFSGHNCRDPAGILEPFDGEIYTPGANPAGGYNSCCTSPYWIGEVLGARHVASAAGVTLWGHDEFFDYVDRWTGDSTLWNDNTNAFVRDVYGYGGNGNGFMNNMWAAYG